MSDYQFMTHEMWCEWWINDEYEVCDCGYREDLSYDEDPKHAGSQPGKEYGS